MFNSLESSKKVLNWINSIFNDPLTEILLNNSHLTKIQAETLIIDSLVENYLDQKISYEEKSKMRRSLKGVSRGAFNRTLHQANKNIISSIYTILFLGYIGLLETPSLDGLVETANNLATYVREYRSLLNKHNSDYNKLNNSKALIILKNEIISRLNNIIRGEKTHIKRGRV